MAQKGKGKKVRFQGGTVFPLIVAIVSVIGLALILYARNAPVAAAAGPQASKGDHWHIAYGIYNCDSFEPNLSGNKEGTQEYLKYTVHSHDDGVMHWHPSGSGASGRNAKLNRFLDVYGVKLTDSKLTLPSDQDGGLTLEEGKDKCDGKDATLKVIVWDDPINKPNDFKTVTTGLDDVRILHNKSAMVIAFVPDGTKVPLPDSVQTLPSLTGDDSVSATTTTTPGSTTPGESTTTVPGATTVPSTATTVPATTAPPG
jgi:hypothetical protein